ncbi:hypothetical protein QT381_14810 [Galbitalea sp. SE-J8]|uniref:hypothetical protein n=1 Tax=Galbitalea sp. SE-J8 TaxID=3054952 RepID=UPI00259C6C1B|nr:hypothetical protein [Galbitalea sp. SE-J8]MDM4764276.1 hypothetical protein [Galbitalea sp. SE-J8]
MSINAREDHDPTERIGSVPEEPVATTALPVTDADPTMAAPASVDLDRHRVLERERAEFGGFKWGSGFFGWLSAVGLTTIILAVVAGTGLALGLGAPADLTDGTLPELSAPIGIGGLVVVLVALFVSYFAGGYVAGRMARFSGVKQGIAVWLWSIAAAVVAAIVAAIAGASFDPLGTTNAFPRIPIAEGDLTAIGIATAVLAAIVPLVAAIAGGASGMRYHRRIDRAGLGA